jgi:uncharacterized membrane protein YhhN
MERPVITPRNPVASLALAAAFIGGVSYFASWGLDLPHWATLVWKGSGVGLLAVYAALRARNGDGWWLCAIMALGAAGDVLLDLSLTFGGAVFLLGHLAAIGLYIKNRRRAPGALALLLSLLVVGAVATVAYLLPAQRSGASGMAIYGAVEAAMACVALMSWFPRAITGLGAVLFVISDLLLFARLGPLAGQVWVNYGVWGLYFAGQTMVCVSVAEVSVRGRRARPFRVDSASQLAA